MAKYALSGAIKNNFSQVDFVTSDFFAKYIWLKDSEITMIKMIITPNEKLYFMFISLCSYKQWEM